MASPPEGNRKLGVAPGFSLNRAPRAAGPVTNETVAAEGCGVVKRRSIAATPPRRFAPPLLGEEGSAGMMLRI